MGAMDWEGDERKEFLYVTLVAARTESNMMKPKWQHNH
jgi:hypothetical protein